jgi:interleukin enhancer-binding factor 2
MNPSLSNRSTLFIFFSDIATEVSVWEGVAVTPLERAYERPPDRKEGDGEEDMEGEAGGGVKVEEDTMETGE